MNKISIDQKTNRWSTLQVNVKKTFQFTGITV